MNKKGVSFGVDRLTHTATISNSITTNLFLSTNSPTTMPPKRRGPTSEDTAIHPQAQGLINHHLPNLIDYDLEDDVHDVDIIDPTLGGINKLRHEGHATAAGKGNHRKQYSKEFKTRKTKKRATGKIKKRATGMTRKRATRKRVTRNPGLKLNH